MYDNHFPEQYLGEYLDYFEMSESNFFEVLDQHVNKKLFKKVGKLWQPTYVIV
jgi:hypothetical protein